VCTLPPQMLAYPLSADPAMPWIRQSLLAAPVSRGLGAVATLPYPTTASESESSPVAVPLFLLALCWVLSVFAMVVVVGVSFYRPRHGHTLPVKVPGKCPC
jgi:hypothetical protein